MTAQIAARRLLVAALLVLAAALGSGAAAAAEKRVALVIGNGDYVNAPRLENPPNDARLMARTLRDLGFTLIGGGAQIDLNRDAMERTVRDFGRAIGPGTIALFYYSGHGMQFRGGNYLVPVPANLSVPSDVDFELFDADVVVRQMDAAHSALNIIILDACRNNPFGGRGLRDGGGGLAEMRPPQSSTLISYATQPGGVAQDGPSGGDSPYTMALVDGIRTKGIDVLKAFNKVGVNVYKATNGSQTPWVASSPIEGEFYLAAPPAPEQPVAAAPAPTQTAMASLPPRGPAANAGLPYVNSDLEAVYWQSIQATNRPEELQAYLDQFPNGTFAGLARARLAILRGQAETQTQARIGSDQPAPVGRPAGVPDTTPPQHPPVRTASASPVAPPPPIEPAPLPEPAPAPTEADTRIGPAQYLEAQRLLLGMGISRAAADGRTGPRTTEALRAFARATSRPDNGELTPAVLVALREPAPPAPSRATALFGLASEAARAGRSADAIALYDLGLRLAPENIAASQALDGLKHRRDEPPPHRDASAAPVTLPVKPAIPPVAAPPPRPAPPVNIVGFSATALDARGRRYQSNGSGSEEGAVTEALRQCHGGGDGATCRIVGLARAGGK